MALAERCATPCELQLHPEHSVAAAAAAVPQVKYLLGVSYKKQDTLQGEVANIIIQLQKGNFKWQEFVMGMAILGFLISLKFIQRK